MPEIEEEIIGSQSEDSEQHEDDVSMDGVYEAFGLEAPKKEEEKEEVKADDPAIDQKPEPRIEKVKHNHGEEDVDISTTEKLHDHLQRSLALDKERERKGELEKSLDRAAKLAGFKDHSEYVANLDKLEQQQQQKEKDAYDTLRQDLRQQAEDAGLDPDKVEEYLNNHPLVKQAEKDSQEREAERLERQREEVQRETQSNWDALYRKYPHLVAESQKFKNGESPDFYTPDMQARIAKGYDPTDAFELAHRDTLAAQSKKAAEQKVIKHQHLGLRSQVETSSAPDNELQVPSALADAFEAFGLPKDSAKNYMKK